MRKEKIRLWFCLCLCLIWGWTPANSDQSNGVPEGRARARDLGIKIGIYEPGEHNAITDVAGVKGHVT